MKTTSTKHVHLRGGTGHLDAHYARGLESLRAWSGYQPEIVGFTAGQIRGDSIAEELGEDFVRTATSGEDDASYMLDGVTAEELGGPFVESTARDEVAHDADADEEPEARITRPVPRARKAP